MQYQILYNRSPSSEAGQGAGWLIEAPSDCIDYVIIHELCHIQKSNHGPVFFELLEQKLPDWERRKGGRQKIMV